MTCLESPILGGRAFQKFRHLGQVSLFLTYLCGWLGNGRVLWSVLMALSTLASTLAPPTTDCTVGPGFPKASSWVLSPGEVSVSGLPRRPSASPVPSPILQRKVEGPGVLGQWGGLD